MTMTHDEVGELAAERYVLHEMTEEQRDAFEEHYADCVVCANEVQMTYAFKDSLRASKPCEENVVQFPPVAARGWRRFSAPVMAAAASLAIGVATLEVVYVRTLQTQLAEARVPVSPVVHVFDQTRGEGEHVFDRNVPNEISVRIDPADEAPKYTWRIVDAKNHEIRSDTVSQLTADLTFPVTVPAKSLAPGNYTLSVVSKRPMPPYSFTVR